MRQVQGMAVIPALDLPAVTSLALQQIVRCFRCNLWVEDRQRTVCDRETNAQSLMVSSQDRGGAVPETAGS